MTTAKTYKPIRANWLLDFMERHKIEVSKLAHVLGVTDGAMRHWMLNRRAIPEVVARCLRMFDENPELIREFESYKTEKL